MSITFICHHCNQSHRTNVRLKVKQRYCGSPTCQQARKNAWERSKLLSDPVYRSKRRISKSQWYAKRPGHAYQRAYRLLHSSYVRCNRSKQQVRNAKREPVADQAKIVKTDTLTSESLIGSCFYALFPCKDACGKKIVKTDALIVQFTGIQGDASLFLNKSP